MSAIRQIAYNNAAFTMRLEFPIGWDIDNLTGVNIEIDTHENAALLASAATSIVDPLVLYSAAAVGDSTITCDAGFDPVYPGDRWRIPASTLGQEEEVEVLHANSSTGVVTLKRELRHAHTAATEVDPLWCTYDLDTSTVATWPKAKQVVITWTPTGSDDFPFKERAEVSVFKLDFPDFSRRFEVLYPREWRIASYRINEILEESKEALQLILSSRNLSIDRVVDTGMFLPAILAQARWLVVSSAGDQWESERAVALEERNRLVEIITNQPIWTDDNQDETKDDDEVDDHAQFMGLERGIL